MGSRQTSKPHSFEGKRQSAVGDAQPLSDAGCCEVASTHQVIGAPYLPITQLPGSPNFGAAFSGGINAFAGSSDQCSAFELSEDRHYAVDYFSHISRKTRF